MHLSSMNLFRRARSLVAPLVGLAILAGCQAAHMPVPEPLSTAAPMAVRGRSGGKLPARLAFGPFEARSIDRSWTRGGDLAAMSVELSRRRQTFTFDLYEDATLRRQVACEVQLRSGQLKPGPVDIVFEDRSTLTCRLDAPTGRWTLALASEHEQPLAGTVADGHSELLVTGTRALRDGLPAETTTGYTIRRAGRAIAAVEVLGNGAVWLDAASAEDHALLAAVATALLLTEDLHAHLPAAPAS